jgi:translation elongation factor P/translation initiation factor 5A
MDDESYEQFTLSAEQLGDDRLYLKDGLSLQVQKYNGAPISLGTAIDRRADRDRRRAWRAW